jgi:glutathionyl-hydroquinone reductase
MDHWFDFSQGITPSTEYQSLVAKFAQINQHLMLNSFLVDKCVTCADFHLWATLKASPLFMKMFKAKTVGVALERWYTHIKSLECVEKAVELITVELDKLKV